jgi:hypothetical protein
LAAMGSRPAWRKDRPPVPERGWRRFCGGLERGREKSVVQRKNEGIRCIGYEGKGAWERKD